jgi:hypothetical protein
MPRCTIAGLAARRDPLGAVRRCRQRLPGAGQRRRAQRRPRLARGSGGDGDAARADHSRHSLQHLGRFGPGPRAEPHRKSVGPHPSDRRSVLCRSGADQPQQLRPARHQCEFDQPVAHPRLVGDCATRIDLHRRDAAVPVPAHRRPGSGGGPARAARHPVWLGLARRHPALHPQEARPQRICGQHRGGRRGRGRKSPIQQYLQGHDQRALQ